MVMLGLISFSICLPWVLCLDCGFLILSICSHFTKCLYFLLGAVHTRKPGLSLPHGNNNAFYLQNICNFLKLFTDSISFQVPWLEGTNN